jgi:hypothetical protein
MSNFGIKQVNNVSVLLSCMTWLMLRSRYVAPQTESITKKLLNILHLFAQLNNFQFQNIVKKFEEKAKHETNLK